MSSPAVRDIQANPESTPSRTPRWAGQARTLAATFYSSWLVPVSLLLGVVLRTREWLFDKSLWIDEIAVTENLEKRSFVKLLSPLVGNQGGPVGWLWAERASIDLFGVHELSLRLVPFLASLVTLAVFPIVARRLVGSVATPVATFLIATSPALIYYAAETKQYSSDTTCALLAMLLTIQLIDRPPTLRSSLLWGLGCGFLAWCSQPTILVAAGCALCLLVRWVRENRVLRPVLAGGGLLAVIVLADWFVTLRALGTNGALQRYWQAYHGYPPVSAFTLGGEGGWLKFTGSAFVRQMGDLSLPILVLALAVWGLATLARLQPWSALLVSLILLVAIAAAITRHYPLAQRLALYLLPLLVLLITAGLQDAAPQVGRSPARPWRQLAVGLCAVGLICVAAPAVGSGISKLVHPDETTAGRQALQFVARHQEPSDTVLTDIWGEQTFAFYGTREHVKRSGLVSFVPTAPTACTGDRLAPIAGANRVWLVLAHLGSNQPANRNQIDASQFAARGTLLASFHGAGNAAAYLYNLREPPSSPVPPMQSWIPHGCFTITLIGPSGRSPSAGR